MGSGRLAADNDQDRCPGADGLVYHDPSTGQTLHWDIRAARTVHLSINAALRVCTSGPFTGRRCTSDADCYPDRCDLAAGFCKFQDAVPASGTPTDIDDVCQAFAYPACVAGRSAADIQACADQQLASGANSCGCTADELVSALSNLNQQFDECAEVIECTGGVASGAFPCEDGATPL